METSHAAELLRALADGVDPVTGEVLPPHSPLQHPYLVRALFAGAEALKGLEQKQARAKVQPERAGIAWTEREDAELIAQFDAGASMSDLAQRHRRTRGAVRARLMRHGKVEPPH